MLLPHEHKATADRAVDVLKGLPLHDRLEAMRASLAKFNNVRISGLDPAKQEHFLKDLARRVGR